MTPLRRAYSVAVYPRHAGRVLLILHRRLGVWLPPGGECEPGEAPLETAARELREETGLVGRFPSMSDIDGTPPGLIGYEERVAGSKGQHLNFVFVADVDTDAVTPNDEFSDWRWVASDEELRALPSPPNVAQLAEVALGRRAPTFADHAAESRRVGEGWLAAWNGRDLDALLALYVAEPEHTSPVALTRSGHARIVGRDALRAYWAEAMARLPGLRYVPLAVLADGDRALLRYTRQAPGEAEREVVVELRVVAGRVAASRVFHG